MENSKNYHNNCSESLSNPFLLVFGSLNKNSLKKTIKNPLFLVRGFFNKNSEIFHVYVYKGKSIKNTFNGSKKRSSKKADYFCFGSRKQKIKKGSLKKFLKKSTLIALIILKISLRRNSKTKSP